MNALSWTFGLAGAALVAPWIAPWIASAQEPQTPAPPTVERRLVPVAPLVVRTTQEIFEPETWAQRLADPDLEAREQAFEELVRLGRQSEEARAWLEAAAAGDGELAWTARLARRELRTRQERWSFFSSDPDFDALEERMRELSLRVAPSWNYRIDPLVNPLNTLIVPPGSSATQHSRRVEAGQDADGWVLRITETADGEESTREYTGESLEEILEAHPELRDEAGLQGMISGDGISLRILAPGDLPFDFDSLIDGFGEAPFDRSRVWLRRRPSASSPAVPVPTDRLGVVVREGRVELAEKGLTVLDTAPGTIAQLLGILPGDVLVEVNGVTIRAADDITVGLGQRPSDGSIQAVWLDAEGRRQSGTWRP